MQACSLVFGWTPSKEAICRCVSRPASAPLCRMVALPHVAGVLGRPVLGAWSGSCFWILRAQYVEDQRIQGLVSDAAATPDSVI